MSPELLQILAQFGTPGLMIGYLVWREGVTEKSRRSAEAERTESDRALASALSALTVTIQHLEQRIK